MPTKKKAGKTSKSKKGTASSTKKDAKGFVDHIHEDRGMRAILKKGWDQAIREGKKRGFKFTKQELHDHLKKRYKVKSLPKGDEPDTCVCI